MSTGRQQPAIDLAEWQLASAQRARLYGWFSALHAEEVSEDMFQTHFAAGHFAPFAGLGELGLAAEVHRLEAAIAAVRDIPLPRLELAADFAQLFLLDAKDGAAPYASAYEDNGSASPLYGAAEARMRDFLASHALSIQPRFGEPADHVAVVLAFMADLAERNASCDDIVTAATVEAAFLRGALLEWLPQFVERCQQANPRFDFYPALAALLIGFVRADLLFLDDVASGAAVVDVGGGCKLTDVTD